MGNYLLEPVTTKQSRDGETARLTVGTCTMQGWRARMEDDFVVDLQLAPDISLFAVFDGHGGNEVANFCRDNLVQVLKSTNSFINGFYEAALVETFAKLDEQLLSPRLTELLRPYRDSDKIEIDMVGATAIVVLVTPTHVICANAGDCRAILQLADGHII